MEDKIQQARRELFEAWTKSEHGDLTRRQDGEYFDDLTHGAWLGFNAALDLAVIELPGERTKRPGFMHETLEDSAHNNCRDLCIDAIESTNLGIKVK